MKKLCRVVWNTNYWRKPSGNSNENESSFAASNGFGFEEWLFNYEWCIGGEKYGFLQPINRALKKYQDSTISVALYTKSDKATLLVAEIKSLLVPNDSELENAVHHFRKNEWIEQMRDDVVAIGGNAAILRGLKPSDKPSDILNVKFRPADVKLYEPMEVFAPQHKASTTKRYQLLDWEDSDPQRTIKMQGTRRLRLLKSEDIQIRAAQQSIVVEPQHTRLQNRLLDSLRRKYGEDAVMYEEEFVDITLKEPSCRTYFEIKTRPTARLCIRDALGQLLEYAHYPGKHTADQLVVVGDAPATESDVLYLNTIRSQFKIPLQYARFDWETGGLAEWRK